MCDAIRRPFDRYGGAPSAIQTDDLGVLSIKALMKRKPGVDWTVGKDMSNGCANKGQ